MNTGGPRLTDEFRDGRLSRRQFVEHAFKLGLTASGAAALLAACIRSNKSALPPPENRRGRVQILVGFSTGNAPAQLLVQQALVDAFIRVHPEVGVDIVRAQGPAEAASKLELLIAAKKPPDLVLPIGLAGIARFVDQKTWLDLRKFIERDSVSLDAFLLLTAQGAHAASYYGAQGTPVVGLPIGLHGRALAYNADLFARAGVHAPPTSWSDDGWTLQGRFLDAARALTIPGQFGLGHFSPEISYFGFGGHFYDPATRRAQYRQAGSVAGIQFAADLVNKHHVQARAADEVQLWRSGKVAMIELCSCEIGGPLSSNLPFAWQTAALPGGPERRFAALDVDVGAIVASGRNHDMAWEMLKFLAVDPVNESIAAFDGFSAIPALKAERDAFVLGVKGQVPSVDPTVWVNGLATASSEHAAWMPAFGAVHDLAGRTFDVVIGGAAATKEMPALQRQTQGRIDAWFKRNKLPT